MPSQERFRARPACGRTSKRRPEIEIASFDVDSSRSYATINCRIRLFDLLQLLALGRETLPAPWFRGRVYHVPELYATMSSCGGIGIKGGSADGSPLRGRREASEVEEPACFRVLGILCG